MLSNVTTGFYKRFPTGSELWGFKVNRLAGKSGRYSITKPVFGVLTDSYFVPYKIKGKQITKELNHNKREHISSLIYSDNREEAIETFNKMIEEEIKECKSRINRLKSEMV